MAFACVNQGNDLSVTPILLQNCLLPSQYVKRMSSGAPMAVASALSYAATTSTTVKTMALMKSTAIRKVCCVTVLLS